MQNSLEATCPFLISRRLPRKHMRQSPSPAFLLCFFLTCFALHDDDVSLADAHLRRPLQSKRPICEGVLCSSHGICDTKTGACKCDDSFGGLDCQLNEAVCPGGQLNSTGACCRSGVFDNKGRCCGDGGGDGKWRLDRRGGCCDRPLNSCGECSATGFLDAAGRCCKGMLDAGGMCCESGALDECGVCNGNGESCTTHLELLVDRNIDAETCLSSFLPSLLRSPSPTLKLRFEKKKTKNGRLVDVTMSGGAVHTLSFRKNLQTSISGDNPCRIRRLENFSKDPTCGNGICEIGEAKGLGHRYVCEDDCPFAFTMCPIRKAEGTVGRVGVPCSGNGRCFFAEGGRCGCLNGYTGSACDRCSKGYFAFNDICHPRQQPYFELETMQDTTLELRGVAINAEAKHKSGGDDTLTLFLCIFLSAAFLCIVGFVVYLRRSRRSKQESKASTGVDALASPSSRTLLEAYLRRFKEFQKSPPWIGSLEKQDQTTV